MRSIVIVAATEFELALVRKRLRCRKAAPLLDFSVYSASAGSKKIVAVRSGPGIANAAAATALAVRRYRPERIFNIGVCGSYCTKRAGPVAAVAGIRAVFADTGVDLGGGFLTLQAIDLPLARAGSDTEVFNSVELSDDPFAAGVTRGVFYTVSAVSGTPETSASLRERFKSTESSVLCEDMESAAVGLVALKAAVPCSVVRGVSNLCGNRDYTTWQLSEAAAAAQEALLQCL